VSGGSPSSLSSSPCAIAFVMSDSGPLAVPASIASNGVKPASTAQTNSLPFMPWLMGRVVALRPISVPKAMRTPARMALV